ncbi:MAG: YHS domain-containing protein, partial [Gemmataceae bacterium]
GGDASMVVQFKGSKNFDKGELRYLPEQKKYQLTVTDKDGHAQEYVGDYKKKYLTLDRVDPKSGETYQLKINTAAEGLRFIYTFSRKAKGSTIFTKLYEVASNKEGESLAGGPKEKECVVTGGLGKIEVSYNGKTYYVCCSGCRDAFNENPAKIIKEYEERKKKGN